MGIATDIALILVAALLGGYVAQRLGQPLLIGYIVAGILVGPYTAGPTVVEIHDIELLAEIGVALLLFALGIEFNLKKLARVRWIAFAGTPIQILLTILLGVGVGALLGWELRPAIWLGAILALSSTMVLLKTMMALGQTGTLESRIMIGMLIVQDLAVVPMLLLLPDIGSPQADLGDVALALLRAGAVLALILLAGTRLMPTLLKRIAAWNSRELFVLAVLAIGLGIGYATWLAGLSFAFGAFVAGMVLSESEHSHQALSDIVPVRDVFGMLFFVSVGMLLDPAFLVANLATVLLLVAAVLLGKVVIFALVVRLFRYPWATALPIGLGLFQIGEFAFVIARVGLGEGALSPSQYSLVLATALVTMALTPQVIRSSGALLERWRQREIGPSAAPEAEHDLRDHIIIAGYGRVGRYTAEVLQRLELPFVILDRDQRRVDQIREAGLPVIYGDASSPGVLEAAGVGRARLLLVVVSAAIDVETIVREVRRMNPQLHIVARATQLAQLETLRELGIHEAVQPEFEAGLELVRQTLLHFDLSPVEIERLSDAVRGELYEPFQSPAPHGSLLAQIRQARARLDVVWMTLPGESPLAGRALGESDVRRRTGATLVAVLRGDELLTNPAADLALCAGDQLAVLGTPAQCAALRALLSAGDHTPAS